MHDNKLHVHPQGGPGELQLPFTKDELLSYVEARALGLSHKTIYRIEKTAATFWSITNGIISKMHMDSLRQFILNKYQSEDSKSKILAFAKALLKYLSKLKLDSRYHAFEIFWKSRRPSKNERGLLVA